MFGSKTDQSSTSASSGMGAFTPKNTVQINAPWLDFSKPFNVLSAIAVAVIWFAAYRKIK